MKWPVKKLGDLTAVLSGFAFDSQFFNNKVGFKLIRIRDVMRGFSKTFYDGQFETRYVVKEGDFLIGMDGEFNIAKWGKEPALLNQRVCKITIVNKRLDANYLFHFLPKQLKLIEDATPFVTVKHLSVKKINDIKIPLPPLAEQKRIAELLDAVDKIILGHKKFISILKILINSYFEKLFSDTNNKKKYKVNDFCFVTDYVANGSFASLKKNVKYLDEGFAVLVRLTDYTKNWESSFKYVSKDSFNFLKKSSLNPGDLIMSNVGECGKTFQVPDLKKPMTLGPNSILIRPNPKIAIPEFLVQYFNEFEGKKKLETIIRTTAQKKFNKTDFRNLEIDLPDMPEQQKFLNLLKIINKIKINKINSLIKSKDLINSLNNQLFFRV